MYRKFVTLYRLSHRVTKPRSLTTQSLASTFTVHGKCLATLLQLLLLSFPAAAVMATTSGRARVARGQCHLSLTLSRARHNNNSNNNNNNKLTVSSPLVSRARRRRRGCGGSQAIVALKTAAAAAPTCSTAQSKCRIIRPVSQNTVGLLR